jgi:hypothetical protein
MSRETEEQKAAIAAAKLLNTENGKVLMDFLEKRTVHQPNFPDASDGQKMAIFMAHQEGEKNLFRYIKSLIEKGGK